MGVQKAKDREGHSPKGHGAAGSSQRRKGWSLQRGETAPACGASRRKRAWQTGDKELSQPQGGEDWLDVKLQGGPGALKPAEGAVSPWSRNETGQVGPGLTSQPREVSPPGIPGSLNQDHGPLSCTGTRVRED